MSDPIITAMQSCELFRDLPEKRLKMIRDAGREVSFPAGAEVMAEGDEAGRLFLIVEGSAEVTSAGESRAVLGPGQAVGELALLDGGRRSATVTATTPLRTFSLASWNFRPFLSEPEVMVPVVALLCRRLREAEQSRAD